MKASETTTSTGKAMMTTAAKTGKTDDKRSKTKKTKGKAVVDEKALEAKLEQKFVLESFYDLRPIQNAYGIFCLGLNLFIMYSIPGSNVPECACCVFWIANIATSIYVLSKYKETKHKEFGMNLCTWVLQFFFLAQEVIVFYDDFLASEEGRNAHVSMIFLTKYFLSFMVVRITANIRCKDIPWIEFVFLPAIAYKQPRFGIFQPRYEALAFFVALGLGYLIGSVIDEMRWRHYLYAHKKEREIKKHKRRVMALEDIACGQESPFFEIIRR